MHIVNFQGQQQKLAHKGAEQEVPGRQCCLFLLGMTKYSSGYFLMFHSPVQTTFFF